MMDPRRHPADSAIRDLTTLLASLEPELHPGVFVYTTVAGGTDISSIPVVLLFREAEAITLITSEADALQANLPILFRAAWITLQAHSHLQAVGLTAACARALDEAGISCNVVAAAYHDHIFVPVEDAQAALSALRRLQDESAADQAGAGGQEDSGG